jgi:hypothetical protein
MKFFPIFLLLFLLSCTSGDGDSSSPTSSPKPNDTKIPPDDDTNDGGGGDDNPDDEEPSDLMISLNFSQIPSITKSLRIENIVVSSNTNLSKIKIYKEPHCQTQLIEYSRTQLANPISLDLIANSVNNFFYKAINTNNIVSINCQQFANIAHDSIAPSNQLSSYLYLFSQNGIVTSNISIKTGGNASELSISNQNQDAIFFYYYRKEGSIFTLIGQGDKDDFLNKNITLILKEGIINNIFIESEDLAGNKSGKSSGGIFIDQNTPSGQVASPILFSNLEEINGKSTKDSSIMIKGIASFDTTSIDIYSNSQLTNKIFDIPVATFISNGQSLNLTANVLQTIYLVAVKNGIKSPATIFSTKYDTIAPPPPRVYDDYFFNETDIFEYGDGTSTTGDSFGPLAGYVDEPDSYRILVFSDSALSNLLFLNEIEPILAFNELIWKFNIDLQLGENPLYIVAEDFAGNRSSAVYRNFKTAFPQ